MRAYTRALVRATGPDRVVVAEVRYRHRGWNGAREDPVRDTLRALDELRRAAGPVPVVLVGHSMGGRAALRAAVDPSVRAVIGLAPWCPPGESVTQLAGKSVVLLHDEADRVTDARASWDHVRRARAAGARARASSCPRAGTRCSAGRRAGTRPPSPPRWGFSARANSPTASSPGRSRCPGPGRTLSKPRAEAAAARGTAGDGRTDGGPRRHRPSSVTARPPAGGPGRNDPALPGPVVRSRRSR